MDDGIAAESDQPLWWFYLLIAALQMKIRGLQQTLLLTRRGRRQVKDMERKNRTEGGRTGEESNMVMKEKKRCEEV